MTTKGWMTLRLANVTESCVAGACHCSIDAKGCWTSVARGEKLIHISTENFSDTLDEFKLIGVISKELSRNLGRCLLGAEEHPIGRVQTLTVAAGNRHHLRAFNEDVEGAVQGGPPHS